MLVGKHDLHECMPAGECLGSAARMQHIDNKFGCVLHYFFQSEAHPDGEKAPYPIARQHSQRLKKCHTLRLKGVSRPKAGQHTLTLKMCCTLKLGGMSLC